MKTLEQFQRGIPHRLIPTNVPGAYASPPFPHGFDPHTASGTALKRHGIPWKRPSGTDHPRLLSAWNSAFSRPWTPENHIVPQLQVQQGKARRSTLSGTVTTDMLHNAWTGVVCQDPFNLNANPNITITGQWVIPTVTKPANGRPAGPVPILNTNDSGWDSSTWIGIDGFFSSDLTLSTDVLQAGVQHYVKLSGEAVYVAWYEWYPPMYLGSRATSTQPTSSISWCARVMRCTAMSRTSIISMDPSRSVTSLLDNGFRSRCSLPSMPPLMAKASNGYLKLQVEDGLRVRLCRTLQRSRLQTPWGAEAAWTRSTL